MATFFMGKQKPGKYNDGRFFAFLVFTPHTRLEYINKAGKTIGGGEANIKASSRVLLYHSTMIVQALFCRLVGYGFPRRGKLQVIPEERLEFEPIRVWVESIA